MSDNMSDEQSPSATDYLERFGLQREPFAAEPDPDFFCADSALTQRLDMLQNLTEFGMLTLLIIGEPGVGKTSVLQQYLQRANSNWHVLHLEGDALGNAHDLVEDLAAGFQMRGADLSQLRAQLDQLRAQGQLAVLAVDDADRLPDTALSTLLELSGAVGETDKRLRLVLCGTEHLQEKLAALSPGHADNTHVFNIPPLSELQTAAYLQHRLKVAGLQEDGVFTTGQVKNIVKTSRGIPARINARAHQLLVDRHSVSGGANAGMRTAAAVMASPARRRALLAAAGVGVLLIAIALWPRSDKPGSGPSNATTESALPMPEKTVELSLPNVAPAAATDAAGSGAAPAEQAPEVIANPLPEPTLGPEVEQQAPTSHSGKIALSRVPAPETAAAPETTDQAAMPAAPTTTTVTLPVAPAAPVSADSPAPVPTPTESGTAAGSAQTAPAKIKAATPTEPPALAKAAPAPKKAAAPSSSNNTWLKAQKPGDFTLQILGGHREAAVRQFATANQLAGSAAILQTLRDGKQWYVLLYGAYPSRAAASQALVKLPAKVRAAKPWPRNIGTLQAELPK